MGPALNTRSKTPGHTKRAAQKAYGLHPYRTAGPSRGKTIQPINLEAIDDEILDDEDAIEE